MATRAAGRFILAMKLILLSHNFDEFQMRRGEFGSIHLPPFRETSLKENPFGIAVRAINFPVLLLPLAQIAGFHI